VIAEIVADLRIGFLFSMHLPHSTLIVLRVSSERRSRRFPIFGVWAVWGNSAVIPWSWAASSPTSDAGARPFGILFNASRRPGIFGSLESKP